MAELDTPINFGIENTMDTYGAGDQNLIDSLLSPDTSTASPDDVSSIEEDTTSTKPIKKSDPTELAGKEDDVPDNVAKDPNALTNFLLGGEDEEEEEEDDDDDVITTSETTTAQVSEEEEENGDNDNTIAFDSLANELADLGVFTRMEGEEEGIPVKSPEEFLERFKKEKQLAANQMISDFIGQFGPEHQEAFEAIYLKGVNPRQYFSQAAKVEDFTNIDLTKESNQERVVRQVLIDQGFENEDIDKEIEKLKNYGDLEDVSKRHHKVLVKKEKEKLAEEAERAKELNLLKQQQKQKYAENVINVLQEKIKAKEFDGIPINVKTANELQDFLLVDKWKTESGETLTDFDKAILDLKRPENHTQKVKVALLLKLLEKDPTLSTIQKSGVSKKSSELFKDLARQKTVANRASENKKQPAKSWFQ